MCNQIIKLDYKTKKKQQTQSPKVGTWHVPGTARHPVWLEHSEAADGQGKSEGMSGPPRSLDFILPLVGRHCDFKQRFVLNESMVSNPSIQRLTLVALGIGV